MESNPKMIIHLVKSVKCILFNSFEERVNTKKPRQQRNYKRG